MKTLFINPNRKVVVIKLFPGIDDKFLMNSINESNIVGVVLEIYGKGQTPLNKHFLSMLQNIMKAGKIIVSTSQSSTDMQNEGMNKTLEGLGVICGLNMTTESALAKLYLIFSNVDKLNYNLIKNLISTSMRGEIN